MVYKTSWNVNMNFIYIYIYIPSIFPWTWIWSASLLWLNMNLLPKISLMLSRCFSAEHSFYINLKQNIHIALVFHLLVYIYGRYKFMNSIYSYMYGESLFELVAMSLLQLWNLNIFFQDSKTFYILYCHFFLKQREKPNLKWINIIHSILYISYIYNTLYPI